MADRARAGLDLLDMPGSTAWWNFLAARFPTYERTAALAFWRDYIIEHGLWDTCKDEGHEFWCRRAEGTCARRGAMTCNETEEEAAALDAAMADRPVETEPISPTEQPGADVSRGCSDEASR